MEFGSWSWWTGWTCYECLGFHFPAPVWSALAVFLHDFCVCLPCTNSTLPRMLMKRSVSLVSALHLNMHVVRFLAITFSNLPCCIFSIPLVHDHILVSCIFFKFPLHSKIHKSKNINPNHMKFFVKCSSSCLLFYGYFSRFVLGWIFKLPRVCSCMPFLAPCLLFLLWNHDAWSNEHENWHA